MISLLPVGARQDAVPRFKGPGECLAVCKPVVHGNLADRKVGVYQILLCVL
jgi:hypothetical protein